MIGLVLAVIVVLSAAIQLGYCFYFFRRIFILPPPPQGGPYHRALMPEIPALPVSVLICARNEAANLEKCLPSVLEQRYHNALQEPLYEVIVVNDQSADDSLLVLKKLQAIYPHLVIVDIPAGEERTLPGKKFALGKGIATAANDYILMTDADCIPASKAWITWMAYPFSQGKEIIGGYGAYNRRPGMLNRFVRAETIHTFLQYYTYTLAGFPYMAVGRNLACKKELLQRAQQHPLWKVTPSGDDDLLVQLCATPDNMVVNRHPASWTYSETKSTWSSWVKQKQRHFSTGKLYHKNIQALLGGYAFSHALFWCGIAAGLCFFPQFNNVFFFALLSRCVFWSLCSEFSDMTGERKLKFFWPLFDVGWLLYNVIFAPFIFWKNKQQWK